MVVVIEEVLAEHDEEPQSQQHNQEEHEGEGTRGLGTSTLGSELVSLSSRHNIVEGGQDSSSQQVVDENLPREAVLILIALIMAGLAGIGITVGSNDVVSHLSF